MTIREFETGRIVGDVRYSPLRTFNIVVGRTQRSKKNAWLAFNTGPDNLHIWRRDTEYEARHELMAYDLERLRKVAHGK